MLKWLACKYDTSIPFCVYPVTMRDLSVETRSDIRDTEDVKTSGPKTDQDKDSMKPGEGFTYNEGDLSSIPGLGRSPE